MNSKMVKYNIMKRKDEQKLKQLIAEEMEKLGGFTRRNKQIALKRAKEHLRRNGVDVGVL